MIEIATRLLQTIEVHSGLAAWLQAIGSVSAIWVSIEIPRQALRREGIAKAKTLESVMSRCVGRLEYALQQDEFGILRGADASRRELISTLTTAAGLQLASLKTRKQMRIVEDIADWAHSSILQINDALSDEKDKKRSLEEQLVDLRKSVRKAEAPSKSLLQRLRKEFRFRHFP